MLLVLLLSVRSVYQKLENYIIKPFTLYKSSSEALILQNISGIVLITENTLKEVVTYLETKTGNLIDEFLIEDLLGENAKKKLNFLIEHSILKINTKPNFNISKVHFYSNSPMIEELISCTFKQNTLWNSHLDFNDFTKLLEIDHHNNGTRLFLIFLNPYNKRIATDLRNRLKKRYQDLSIFSYIYKGHLYIESIYSPKWNTPCHLCQINHLEAELRVGSAHRFTYQQMIDLLYEENNDFALEVPLEYGDVLNISTQIVNRMNKLFALKDEVNISLEEFTKGAVMDLLSKELYTDTTHHWEMCDCYE